MPARKTAMVPAVYAELYFCALEYGYEVRVVVFHLVVIVHTP